MDGGRRLSVSLITLENHRVACLTVGASGKTTDPKDLSGTGGRDSATRCVAVRVGRGQAVEGVRQRVRPDFYDHRIGQGVPAAAPGEPASVERAAATLGLASGVA